MDRHPDADAAMKLASEEARLNDFGDERFVDGLSRYFEALNAEANLTPVGHAVTNYDVTQLLVNRLRFEDDLKRHPEILDEVIIDPLIILGLPRTGTTKLQQLLGRDTSVLKVPYYQIVNPAPLPGAEPGRPDPRIAAAEATVQAMGAQSPEFLVAHPPQATEPEEEAFFMRMTFEWCLNGVLDHVPSHLSWLMEQPQEYNYQYLRRVLQYLQWQDGGARGRPWILKSPLHSRNLDVLLRTFPNATVVQCHRDPCEVTPSILRLHEIIWRERGSQADLTAVTAFLEFWRDQMLACMEHRKALGSQSRIIDVQYADILQDPLSVARGLYQRWGRTLTPEAEHSMAAWEEENPQYRFGKHTYSLERYGLTQDRVEQAFAPYLQSIEITPTPKRG